MIKKPVNIVAFFINFLFVVGVILMVVGFIGGLRFSAYTYLFDEYPLGAYEDCSYISRPIMAPGEKALNDNEDTYKQELERCQQNLISRRKISQVNDAVSSIGMLISGFVLVWLFNPKGILTRSYK